MVPLRWCVLVVALGLLGACKYEPTYQTEACRVRCGAGNACPAGWSCNLADGYCHQAGDTQVCTGG